MWRVYLKSKNVKISLFRFVYPGSHIAFGSIRMEPVFMIMGQAAATVASLAMEKNGALHDVDYTEIKKQLLKDKQKLNLAEVQ